VLGKTAEITGEGTVVRDGAADGIVPDGDGTTSDRVGSAVGPSDGMGDAHGFIVGRGSCVGATVAALLGSIDGPGPEDGFGCCPSKFNSILISCMRNSINLLTPPLCLRW
jgi:hypothetical protein